MNEDEEEIVVTARNEKSTQAGLVLPDIKKHTNKTHVHRSKTVSSPLLNTHHPLSSPRLFEGDVGVDGCVA